MRVSFKDINGIKVKGQIEYIYPRLSQDGKLHSWYLCIKLEDGRFIKGVCYKIEDCKFTLDEDENPALYPYDTVEKLKAENARLKKEIGEKQSGIPINVINMINEQFSEIGTLTEKNTMLQEQNERVCKENEQLKQKLAEYEGEAELREELTKMKQIVINSEQAQKLSDYINNLHNVVGELKFISLNEIPIIHLNSFGDCQKLEAEPIKPDNYDDIINRLLKFRTRVEHEHIQFRNGLLELIDIVLKLVKEVQNDNL